VRAPSVEPRLPARPALRAAAIVALVQALPLVDRAAFAAVLERVRADLWLTDLQLGLAASLPAIVAGLLALRRARGDVAAPSAAAVRGRLRSAAAPALWGVAAALSGAARGAVMLLLARAVAGGAARSFARGGAETGAAVPPGPPADAARVATAAALAALGYAGAGALGWSFGWRAALVAAAVASLAVAATTAWSRRPAADVPTLASGAPPARGSRAAIFGGALVAFAAGALATWTPAFLERARGVPRAIAPLEMGAAVLMAGAAAAWARGFAAEALHRANASRWLCPGAALAAAPLAVAALLARRPVAYLAALVAALALVLVALAALRDALARALPGDRLGAAGALAWIALVGDAPAALLVGAISHRTSLWWAMLAVPVALLAGGALLAHAARREE
jgi:hypothetical protein